MALPKHLRLKGHRTFKYLHKNSKKYYGKLIDFKIAKSFPQILISHKNYSSNNNFKIAISVSKKVSKKSVVRNKIRRMLHEYFLKNFKLAMAVSKKVSKKAVVRNKIRRLLQQNFLRNFNNEHNHIPYWVLVNVKGGNIHKYETELLKEFRTLILKTGLLK